MAVVELTEIPALIPRYSALIGLDLGEKTIGVAVSDTSRMIASPLQLIRKTKFTQDAERVFKLMDGRKASALVIGLPVNMDGTEGPRAQSCRAFARTGAASGPSQAPYPGQEDPAVWPFAPNKKPPARCTGGL